MDVHRKPRTILVVDDNPEARELTAHVLRDEGFRVHEATNGGDALELLSEIDEVLCLAIIDLVMPVLDGRKLIERLRQVSKGIPVIVITGSGVAEIPGVASVVAKPVDPEVLRSLVRRFAR